MQYVTPEEDTASLLQFLLGRAGYMVLHARDGMEAQRPAAGCLMQRVAKAMGLSRGIFADS
ncbi:MAG: hypothetical protein NW703_12520 [Nitrospiraceae bacterium]